jgi:hypothetical protein
VASASHIAGTSVNEPDTQVSFDGGAKDGVSGAGAALWVRNQSKQWRLAATSKIALPGIGHPQIAEAWGLKLAILLIIQSSHCVKTCRIIGDSLSVVRYGAAQGLLRKPEVQAILEAPLSRMASAGWSIEWAAIEGRHNSSAHNLATAARKKAQRLSDARLRSNGPATQWIPHEGD